MTKREIRSLVKGSVIDDTWNSSKLVVKVTDGTIYTVWCYFEGDAENPIISHETEFFDKDELTDEKFILCRKTSDSFGVMHINDDLDEEYTFYPLENIDFVPNKGVIGHHLEVNGKTEW